MPAAPYALNANVPLEEMTEQREAFVSEFSELAPQIGLGPQAAQGLLDMIVDSATALTYEAPDEHTDDADAFHAMTQTYGEKTARDLVNRAQQYVKRLGPQVADYLDRTNLDNDVGVLTSLALADGGWLKLTPAQAKEQVDRLMKSDGYLKGDKLTMIKLHTASRIAHRGDMSQQEQLNHAARQKTNPNPVQKQAQANAAASEATRAEARAEAAKMMSEKDGPLMNANHQDHAAAVAKWHALTAQL